MAWILACLEESGDWKKPNPAGTYLLPDIRNRAEQRNRYRCRKGATLRRLHCSSTFAISPYRIDPVLTPVLNDGSAQWGTRGVSTQTWLAPRSGLRGIWWVKTLPS